MVAHLKCFKGSQPPSDGDGFVCKECCSAREQRKGKSKTRKSTSRDDEESGTYSVSDDEDEEAVAVVKEVSSGDEDAYHTPDDDDVDTGSDFGIVEYPAVGQNKSTQQAREERWAAEEEEVLLRSLRLEEFVDEDQPDDKTRHLAALLRFPKEHVWTEADLDKETYLRMGLHVLYNKIQGKEELHFGRSIHIKYDHFPKRNTVAAEKKRAVNPSRENAARTRGLV